ncbi:MAG: hypothetical protein GEV08_19970 [Acidimicrobiia bacterium]|nr:hypothetical protein [Acidimicrobiia bacterium]
MAAIASFDVFDTVLARVVGSPATAFLVLGRVAAAEGLVRASPEVFARARVAAEDRCIARHGAAVTTQSIYQELAYALALSDEDAATLVALEWGLERRLVRPAPSVVAAVQRARARGARVVFMSDTHLPPSELADLLREAGALERGDGLYTSSAIGRAKWTGELFETLLEAEGVAPGQAEHLGNHRGSDVAPARRHGIRAEHHAAGNLNRYEEILERHTWATGGLSSVLAGVSRLARLTVPAGAARDVALRDVTASVAAPLLTGFVMWVLERARALELDRLYFLSRDGEVLLDMARHFAPAVGTRAELRYLLASRHAVNLASTGDLAGRDVAWLTDVEGMNSPRSMAHQLGLADDDVRAALGDLGLSGRDDDAELTSVERARVADALCHEPSRRRRVLDRAAGQRQALLDYLDQEEVLAPGRIGLVDLGWRGTTQHAIEQLTTRRLAAEVHGLYLGADPAIDPGYEPGRREAYLFDRRRGVGIDDLPEAYRTMLEVFCTGGHGPVIGYEHDGDVVRPVLARASNEAAATWGLAVVRATVAAFCEGLPLDGDLVDPRTDVRAATAESFRLFLDAPTRAEAAAWSAYPLECDSAGLYTVPVGQPYTRRDLLTALRRGWERHHRYSWHGGSLALSPPEVRTALVNLRRAKGRARRVVRLVARGCGR